ncbi:hypothetical protein GPECTOR_561g583 [Gonium pectorale]|uniref:DRBM domain-containing protein n=1 Tax=Gonium pectorale TaxID=33097 RepID=A0A150FUK3_GONPE|nr:hypothetical protein GPECTOR_561g583 [Gonium pectorale]|eukprot:KXZ41313.1 hypothetical protein GPECTOR_561g583 [Gonium pectorale]
MHPQGVRAAEAQERVEFPQTGALVRLYVALGIRPETAAPRPAPGVSARWHPLTSILPPVNAAVVLRPDRPDPSQPSQQRPQEAGAPGGEAAEAAAGSGREPGAGAAAAACDEEAGGDLLLEAGIAPFLAKLKSLLNKHPEWRISQLDPHLTSLIQLALAPPPAPPPVQQQQQQQQQQPQQQEPGTPGAAPDVPPNGDAYPQQPGSPSLAAAGADGAAAAAGGGAGGDDDGGGGGGVRVKEEPLDESAAPHTGPQGPPQQQPEAGPAPGADLEAGAEARCGGEGGGGGDGEAGTSAAVEADGAAGGEADSWRGPRPQQYLADYCRAHGAAALAAILWLDGAIPPDGGEAEALLREMDKKRQRLVAEAAELEALMAALRGGGWEGVQEPDLARLTASLGRGTRGGGGRRGGGVPEPSSSGLSALAGSVTLGLRALQFRSASTGAAKDGGPGGGQGGRGGRVPGTKRPRDDCSWGSGGSPAPSTDPPAPKNVIMELKELCDRKRWPQPQYAFTPLLAGPGGQGATAVVTLPPAAGLQQISSGPQANRKRAKEAAAAAALAQLSALGLK